VEFQKADGGKLDTRLTSSRLAAFCPRRTHALRSQADSACFVAGAALARIERFRVAAGRQRIACGGFRETAVPGSVSV